MTIDLEKLRRWIGRGHTRPKNGDPLPLAKYSVFFVLAFSLCPPSICARDAPEAIGWHRSGADNQSTKFSDLSQINATNIGGLAPAWEFHSGYVPRVPETVQTNPVFTGKQIITTSLDGSVIALDPGSGALLWKFTVPQPAAKRGLTYYKGNVYVPSGRGVYVLDAVSGKLTADRGKAGVYGDAISFLPPVVTDSQIVSASFPGVISAWGARDGKLLWQTNLLKDGVLARLWSGFSYDDKSGLLYVVTSDTGRALQDGQGKSGNANSIIALDFKTGKLVWQFQEIENDLWDLDMVGPPIVTSIKHQGVMRDVVVSVSKSGNVIVLERAGGKPLDNPEFRDVNGQRRIKISKPSPFSSNVFAPADDVTTLTEAKHDYVMHKIRHAKFEQYAETTITNPVVLFGLHGGGEWPGAAVDPGSHYLVVTSNRYPWIIRANIVNASAVDVAAEMKKNSTFVEKCQNCHQADLTGYFEDASSGDRFVPPLIGASKLKTREEFSAPGAFAKDHKYASLNWNVESAYQFDRRMPARALKSIDRMVGGDFLHDLIIRIYVALFYGPPTLRTDITEDDLKSVYETIRQVDDKIENGAGMTIKTFFQVLLDPDGLPGSNPPWGLITAIDLDSGLIAWSRPFGEVYDNATARRYEGDRNFGGALITGAGLVFATGTTDEFARAFLLKSGQELWKAKLPAAGSAPPMTYSYGNCQYVLFTASGGKFVGFRGRSDATVAYRLKNCAPL